MKHMMVIIVNILFMLQQRQKPLTGRRPGKFPLLKIARKLWLLLETQLEPRRNIVPQRACDPCGCIQLHRAHGEKDAFCQSQSLE
jgi:hypothetical protein